MYFKNNYYNKERKMFNKQIYSLIHNINNGLKWYEVKLGAKIKGFSGELRDALRYNTGVYFIKTDTPIDAFANIGYPVIDKNKHKNIPQIIQRNEAIIKNKLNIQQHEHNQYIVYNGEAKDISGRIVAHLGCPMGTGCLALYQYGSLREYKWSVAFYIEKDEMKRNLIEQSWRGIFGWPILCEK